MEAHDPNQHPFGPNVELAAHLLIQAIDGLAAPRKLESNVTVHSLGDSLGSLAAEEPNYRLRYVIEGGSEITVNEISDAAIASLRSYGIKVGVFRRRKIRRILDLA